MKRYARFALMSLILVFGVSTVAKADCPWWDPWCSPPPKKPAPAPEIDPSLAVSGLALLAGSLTVLRARKRK
jgi:hypothetical protein